MKIFLILTLVSVALERLKVQKQFGTLHIMDLDKLNFVMVVWLYTQANFATAQLPQKILLASKVVKSNWKIIISIC